MLRSFSVLIIFVTLLTLACTTSQKRIQAGLVSAQLSVHVLRIVIGREVEVIRNRYGNVSQNATFFSFFVP